jgi:hypothetical protein
MEAKPPANGRRRLAGGRAEQRRTDVHDAATLQEFREKTGKYRMTGSSPGTRGGCRRGRMSSGVTTSTAIAGGRLRGRRTRRRRFRLSFFDSFDEDSQGGEAEPAASSAGLRKAGNDGAKRRPN